MKRREFVSKISAAGLVLPLHCFFPAVNKFNVNKLGACDWSLGKSSDPLSFEVAQAIGLAGVQVNMGNLSNDLHLRQKSVQEIFLKKSKETKISITSLAIGELNNIPYKSDDRTTPWVADSIGVAKNMGVEVVLLAFFSKNDLRNDPKGVQNVIAKLKEIAPDAEKQGITLGIESYLTAEEHLDIMEKVGSKAIKVYYDFRNAKDAGNDIFHEIKLLGNKNICEIHLKENGKFLGTGDIDWQKVSNALQEIGYSNKKWQQLEWSLPDKYDFVSGHQKNLDFIQSLK
ncbi:MAG: sugar phosphate isomerase/epimerase family protein [Leadbetterella sp.]|nr:sugar phosphate isomerase/epimerase family protein [Leadbetterella sp.]